jgi:molybdopterin converting factor subunit 1
MQVTVRFFAVTREIVGATSQVYTLSQGGTLQTLQAALFETFPELAEQRVRFAVNQTYASSLLEALHDGDEVACIPPVGGG